MGKYTDVLKAIQQNPDDLTQLPQLIEQIEQLEQSEFAYQERIARLQEINKAYLAQIPITTELPKTAKTDEPPAEPSMTDVVDSIAAIMNGGN